MHAETVPDRYLRLEQVLKRVPISRPTIYRMMKQGKFPKARKLGWSTLWIESEIEHFMKTLPEI